MQEAIDRLSLDLTDRIVLTEAASGAYIVTPIIAAMSGAKKVYALTKSSRFGNAEDIEKSTYALAEYTGVEDRIEVITSKLPEIIAQADIITNSGHIRPIDRAMIELMKPTAVIPLMYEAWEFRQDDVDIKVCRQKGIRVAGTNERHPAIDVFSFLGNMAVKMANDGGLSCFGNHIIVLCDNNFNDFICAGLKASGAKVLERKRWSECHNIKSSIDGILVALTPQKFCVLTEQDIGDIANRFPDAVVLQFWGDIDRRELQKKSISFWPITPPPLGHMGILPSDIGPEPIIRLQCGGLKVGEVLVRLRPSSLPTEKIDLGIENKDFAQPLLFI